MAAPVEKPRRASVGFQGGQVMSLRITSDALEKLQRALSSGSESWHALEDADGAVLIDLGEVVYLRVEFDEHRVGF